MRLPLTLIALASLLMLSACTSPNASSPPGTPAVVAPSMAAGMCNADPAQFALGRTVDGVLESDARARSGAKLVRVLRPGQIVTMEFSAERLNLTVDAAGKVMRVSCG